MLGLKLSGEMTRESATLAIANWPILLRS